MTLLLNNHPIDNHQFSEDILHDGLCIYEVCRVFRGKVIFLSDNLSRLSNSIKKSGVDINPSTLHVEEKLNKLIAIEHIKEGNIKYVLRITPSGVDEYIYQIPHSYPTEEAYENGVPTLTYRAIRKNAEIKYINPELRSAADRLIHEKGVYEILLVDNDDCITEGSRSNVFFLKDNTLYTSPLPYVLPGTSRKRVLSLCEKHQIPVIQERIPLQALPGFQAAFLTGTSPLVLPISRVDDQHFNPHHPLLKQVMELYVNLLSEHV